MHLLVVLFTFALATTSFAQPAPTATIMETLLRARQDRVSSIVQAIQAAGLADTLQKDGPFILFAPSNDAFKALPEGTLGKLLAAPADLKKILLNHVVKVNVPSNELKSGDLTSLGGSVLKVVVSPTDNSITVNNAKIYTAMNTTLAMMTSNGVVFYIDHVLLP